MRERDAKRLDLWLAECKNKPKYRTKEVFIKRVGRETENQWGFCQAIDIYWGEGFPEIINNRYTEQIFAIDEGYRGPIKMSVRWEGGWWGGKLTEPLPPIADWTWVPKIDAMVFSDILKSLEEHLFKGEIE